MQTYGVVIGRVCLGLLFFVSGIFMLMNMGVSGVAGMLEGMGVPLASLVAVLVLAVKILGGAGLILGYKAREAAYALIIFTFFTIVLVHNNMAEMTQALKNLAIIGGLFYVAAFGAGSKCCLGGDSCDGGTCAPKA